MHRGQRELASQAGVARYDGRQVHARICQASVPLYIVKGHTETSNPSGEPLEVAGCKHTAYSANLSAAFEDRGTEVPLDEHAPTTEHGTC